MTEPQASSGWAPPSAPVAGPPGSLVIAGPGARVVAYLIDGMLTSAIPSILSFLALDFAGMFDAAMDASRRGATVPTTLPVTLDIVLVTLIGVGIQFVYYVGFWTSGWRATPGMRLLRMQAIDALDSGRLTVEAAIRRWALLGYPIALLALIEPVQAVAGPLSMLVLFIVFVTVVADPRRQGFHDRAARSLVVRDPTSGNEATAIGCLVLVGLGIVFAVVLWLVFVAVVGERLFDGLFPVQPF